MLKKILDKLKKLLDKKDNELTDEDKKEIDSLMKKIKEILIENKEAIEVSDDIFYNKEQKKLFFEALEKEKFEMLIWFLLIIHKKNMEVLNEIFSELIDENKSKPKPKPNRSMKPF